VEVKQLTLLLQAGHCPEIPMNSSGYVGYANVAIDGYHWGNPQLVHLDQEFMGNPKMHQWAMLTNQMVFYDGCHHVQINSMYGMT
jgi:hypothetical protein